MALRVTIPFTILITLKPTLSALLNLWLQRSIQRYPSPNLLATPWETYTLLDLMVMTVLVCHNTMMNVRVEWVSERNYWQQKSFIHPKEENFNQVVLTLSHTLFCLPAPSWNRSQVLSWGCHRKRMLRYRHKSPPSICHIHWETSISTHSQR